jgi:hypothetical protein
MPGSRTLVTTRTRPRLTAVAGLAVAAAVALGACGGGDESSESAAVPQPSRAEFAAAGMRDLPVAPQDQRVDLTAPPFSDSTQVTNPLFPISDLRSAVLAGRIDGKPFHTETTLLPYTRTIEWAPGRSVETLVSQYTAFLDGRIQEVALDYYAQADDGSVWYFGEDVNDYNARGLVAFQTDSWLAGPDGPPAMIMPGDPKVGDAFRTENIPGLVFEEVTVKTIDKTVAGPTGKVANAMVGEELHDDAQTSDKVFAPGYGEFLTRDSDGVEAMALAVPTDAVDGQTPKSLQTISSSADVAFHAAMSKEWSKASAAVRSMNRAWRSYVRTGEAPPRLEPPMDQALASLDHALRARDRLGAGTAAIDVAQAALDLELRYRPVGALDRERFGLWARQVVVDADAGDLGGVRGDLATLELVRDRFASGLPGPERARINASLLALRDDVEDKDLAAAGNEGARLKSILQPDRASRESGRPDLNQRPPAPKAGALPGCATPRCRRV